VVRSNAVPWSPDHRADEQSLAAIQRVAAVVGSLALSDGPLKLLRNAVGISNQPLEVGRALVEELRLVWLCLYQCSHVGHKLVEVIRRQGSHRAASLAD